MKKIEKKFIAAIVSVLILIPSATASAATNNTPSGTKNPLTKEQKLQTLQERQQIKAAMASKKETIKSNHATNSALRQEIAQKRAEVKTIRKDIKDNNRQLTTEDLEKVKAQLAVVKSTAEELKATRGTIKAEFELVRAAVKNLNLDEALTHLDKIIEIQNTRTGYLKSLSSQMDTLIDILKTAVANSTTSTEPSAQI